MGQIGELIWGVGMIVVVTVFGIGKSDPIHIIEKVPVCQITCTVESTPTFPMGTVVCRSKTDYVWSDFTQRVVDAGGHCGQCGTPTNCPKIKQFDEYKED